jgi:hypothetical protein
MDEAINSPLLAELKVYHEGCWNLRRYYSSQAYYGTLLKGLSKLSYASIPSVSETRHKHSCITRFSSPTL